MPDAGKTECVKVVVRCRPMNDKEQSSGRASIVEVGADGRELALLPNHDDPATTRRSFTFDKARLQCIVFYPKSTRDGTGVWAGYLANCPV